MGGRLVDSKATPESDGFPTVDLSGRRVGGSYVLRRPIGHGATGTVWEGVDESTCEPVAVKLLHQSLMDQPKLVTRFVQERTILKMLRHRHVVRVRDLFSVGESLGLVMDLVSGGSLRTHLREHGPFPAGEAARLAAQVAAALTEAHELGVVHRDLKPDNILLLTENGRLETRLTDFGIARVLNTPGITTPNAVVGTPHYMSPEAFHGSTASPAADVYALGVLLYELVCGRPPYESDNVADLMRRHVEGNPERRPGIPDPIWRVITSCLSQKPRLRPTAAELVAELTAVARNAADAPALPVPDPSPSSVAAPAAPPAESVASAALPGGHPSAIVPAPRLPQPRNQVPKWRWARPGATLAVVAGAMLASGVATTAWHVVRSGGGGPHTAEAAPRLAGPPSATPPPATPSASGAVPRPSVTTTASSPVAAHGRPAPAPAATTVATTTVAARRSPVPEAKPYGPWQCQEALQFSLGSSTPVLAQPCVAVGGKVQAKGSLAAPSGGTATVGVSLQDTGGRTVAGPKTCSGLSFAENSTVTTRTCGPLVASPPTGRSYVVVLTWTYIRDGRTVRGSAKGKAFSW
jgi:serine/threonine protein kinase